MTKNILIITANPSSKGFSHKIAQEHLRISEENKSNVEIINLYKKEWMQEYLNFEDIKKDMKTKIITKKTKKIIDKISLADELIFIHPMWWNSMPAIMKNFIDSNFLPHFAFIYENGIPKGLLKGKIAKIFVTADTPKEYFNEEGDLNKELWLRTLEFCGLEIKSYKLFTSMNKKTENEKLELLTEIKVDIEK